MKLRGTRRYVEAGDRYGMLLVLKREGAFALCRCDCGNQSRPRNARLVNGDTVSCGCARTKHGMSGTVVYERWLDMRQRCLHHPRYLALQITVCERWRSFDAFYADMGDPPTASHELDRRDGSRGYEPGNCRWATRQQQVANRLPRQKRTSPYVGVYSVPSGRWIAKCAHKHIGTFESSHEAAAAYDAECLSRHGAFAVLNFQPARDF